MDPKLEGAKGRVKEAAGALTGNEDLKAEGAAEQLSAKGHQAVKDATDQAKDAVGRAADAVQGAIDSAGKKLSK